MSKCWGLLLRSCAYKIIHRKKRSFEANILKENQLVVSAINSYKVQPRKVNPKNSNISAVNLFGKHH
jgi:hypothetical protein